MACCSSRFSPENLSAKNLEQQCNRLLTQAKAEAPTCGRITIAYRLGLIQIVTYGKTVGGTALSVLSDLLSLGASPCSDRVSHAFEGYATSMKEISRANLPIFLTATVAQIKNLKPHPKKQD